MVHFFASKAALAVSVALFSLAAPVAAAPIVLSLDVSLQYQGDVYSEVEAFDDIETIFTANVLASEDDPFGLPTLFPGLAVGDMATFSASYSEDNETFPGSLAVESCTFAGVDCSGLASASFEGHVLEQDFFFFEVLIDGGIKRGDTLQFLDIFANDFSFGEAMQDDVTITWRDQAALFTVESATVAKIPLPASVFLLALGLFGLRALRRK
ncbi:MAG: hypothetical protein AAGG57_08385 [Pseudomonadota bacterium]